MKTKYFLLWAAIAFPMGLFGQEIPVDTTSEVNVKIFNIVITQGLMTNALKVDTMPLKSAGSGTFFIGGGFIINLHKNTFGLRLTPGFSFVRYTYESSQAKTFPTSFDSLKLERHRLNLVEVPLGFYYNFKKTPEGNPKIYGELGGYAGYRFGSAYKTKATNDAGQQVTTIVQDVADLQRFRYGLYTRFGYKWVALYAAYRLSDVWIKSPADNPAFIYPKLPALEIGLTVFL